MKKELLKRIASIFMVFVLVFSTFTTINLLNNKTNVYAASYKLNKKKATLNVGDTLELSVKNLGEDDTVKWTSSKPKVCKVSSDGVVTPKKKGKAVIKAKVNGTTLKCTVKVRNCYTISKKSKLIDVGKNTYSTYSSAYVNSYTYDWYLFRCYLEQLELDGGGTLVVKKGTYNITNVLCIPSNVNIIFKKGAKINKTSDTHTNKFAASKTLFELVPQSKYYTKNWAKKYNGVKNVKLIGKGNNVIDTKYYYESIAVTIYHSKNISISGITFKNINEAHSIEVDAAKNVEISNCSFSGQKGSNKLREAINLDIPDGYKKVWSKNDKTPNNGVIIKDCEFKNLYVGIGSHYYSVSGKNQVYHKNVLVDNCTFNNMKKFGVQALNWSNSTISNSTFNNIGSQGVAGRGSQKLDVKDNKFKSCKEYGVKIVDYQIKKILRTYPTYLNGSPEEDEEYILSNNEFEDNGKDVECKIIIPLD